MNKKGTNMDNYDAMLAQQLRMLANFGGAEAMSASLHDAADKLDNTNNNLRQALQALVEVVAPMIEHNLTFVGKNVVIAFDSHDEAVTAVAVARDMLRGARKAIA